MLTQEEIAFFEKQQLLSQKKIAKLERKIDRLNLANKRAHKVVNFFQKRGALPIVLPILVGLGVMVWSTLAGLSVGNFLDFAITKSLKYLGYGAAAGFAPAMIANIIAGSIGARRDNAIQKCNKEKVNLEVIERQLRGIVVSEEMRREITQRYEMQSPLIEKNQCAPSLIAEYRAYKNAKERAKQ